MQSHLPLHKVIWEHSPRKHNFPNSQGHHAQNTSQKLPQTKDLIFSHFPCSATQVLQIRKLDSNYINTKLLENRADESVAGLGVRVVQEPVSRTQLGIWKF